MKGQLLRYSFSKPLFANYNANKKESKRKNVISNVDSGDTFTIQRLVTQNDIEKTSKTSMERNLN